MKRSLCLGLGTVLVVVGVVWILQGTDALGQSGGMNGQPVWAVIGIVTAVSGLVLAGAGLRGRRTRR